MVNYPSSVPPWTVGVVLALVLLLAASCGIYAPTMPPLTVARGSNAATATPAPTATPDDLLHRPGMTLERCTLSNGAAARCGTLTVYENPAANSGRQIEIFVAVKPATSQLVEPDPVFFLAGGPGAAASQAWAVAGIFPGLNDHRDIVLVDQRGTGRSHAMVYPPPPTLTGMSAAQAQAVLSSFYAKALDQLDGDPRYYTTFVAMEDLDKVRAALGYERINLYGGSYGVTAAQYYLRQHGEHVRAVVLDGGTLVDLPLFEYFGRNAQRALDLTFARCEGDAACRKAFPNARTEYAALVERARRGELKMMDPTTNQTVNASVVTLEQAAQSGTINAVFAAQLPYLIHKVYTENVFTGQDSGIGEMPVMAATIRCSEAWARYLPDETARLSSGTLFEEWAMDGARTWDMLCKALPKGVVPANDGERARSEASVLILTGEADPQNPPENVAHAANELPNSLSIVVPWFGHTVGHLGCMPQVVSDFFIAGTTTGLDTTCVAAMTPPAFTLN
jgi:pimeloyl-ACP methyl ester carboxylesterase